MSCSVQTVTNADNGVDIDDAWNKLLTNSKSPEIVFQTSGYFDFISEIPNKNNKQVLLLIRNTETEEIIGVIPLRTGQRTIFLQVGTRTVGRMRIATIALLGSIPLTPQNFEVFDALLQFLFKEFPHEDSIAMQCLPLESYFYDYLKNSPQVKKNYGLYIKDGWRNCHSTPLPINFSTYLSRLKAKKRYNLRRQIKQFEKDFGPLVLIRIQLPQDVPLLMHAINKLLVSNDQDSKMGEAHYLALSHKKILLCYVLTSNKNFCAVIIGIYAKNTFHIHKIIYDYQLTQYSLGKTVLHLAIEDLTDRLHINLIDYGYGEPEHSHHSGNVIQQRGQVFLYKKTLRNRLLFAAHAAFTATLTLAKKLKPRPRTPLLGTTAAS